MTIFYIVMALLLGVAIGYLGVRANEWLKGGVNQATTVTIYLLIFSMGLAVGANRDLMQNIFSVGFQSIFISLMAMIGSIAVVVIVVRLRRKKGHN